ncbi:MFS transporter [Nonomuraea dietziae]|uniref:MFS transporter n=1 Tax=Nonomuraea dietziae TaxID=65515 RepID=UPI0031E31A13
MTDDTSLGARGRLVLTTLCGATFMTGLDYSIITVALPAIGRDLGFATASGLQWVVTACLLPTAALMPLFGRASDVVGRRRLFMAGVVAFMAFSLVAALAELPGVLVAARAGQGVAAAMIGPTSLALMTSAFPEGPRRARAMGVNGALLSLGFVIGTIGGGLITSGLNWRWTMLILMAIGALVLLGAVSVVRESESRSLARLDVPGALLASAGLFALVYGISAGSWLSVGASVVLLGLFLVAEGRHVAPLVPLGLLRRTTVKWGMALGLVTFGMCGGATLLLSIHMQDVLGYSALQTGLGFLGEGGRGVGGGGRRGPADVHDRHRAGCSPRGWPSRPWERPRWRSCRSAVASECCSRRRPRWGSGTCSPWWPPSRRSPRGSPTTIRGWRGAWRRCPRSWGRSAWRG